MVHGEGALWVFEGHFHLSWFLAEPPVAFRIRVPFFVARNNAVEALGHRGREVVTLACCAPAGDVIPVLL